MSTRQLTFPGANVARVQHAVQVTRVLVQHQKLLVFQVFFARLLLAHQKKHALPYAFLGQLTRFV